MFKLFIANLKEGVSRQEFTATPAELELPDDEEFKHEILIRLDIDKVGKSIFVVANLRTETELICDRCVEPFTSPVTEEYRLLFTSDPEMANDEDDSTFLITETTNEVDMTEPLRETLMLGLPFKRLCRQDCKGLCKMCGANLNEKTCVCKSDHIDPRWDNLKSLLN
jgi:uncharacterized protein